MVVMSVIREAFLHRSTKQKCCCRLTSIPVGRQHIVGTFVTGYMQQVKDCHMAETGSGTLAISCGSSEILNNATTALEQVTALSIWLESCCSGLCIL